MRFNLSEINELIRQRRTIYPEQFTSRKVHKEQIEVILRNAQHAPTHGNTQPWRFKVFTEDAKVRLSNFLVDTYKKITKVEDQKETTIQKLSNRPLKSSVVIAVTMHRDRTGKISELEEIEAVACAIQNMYLSTTAYGMGGFWSTPKIMYSQEMNDFLNIEKEDKCLGLFYIGYPGIEWPKSHRKPLEYATEWITQ